MKQKNTILPDFQKPETSEWQGTNMKETLKPEEQNTKFRKTDMRFYSQPTFHKDAMNMDRIGQYFQ